MHIEPPSISEESESSEEEELLEYQNGEKITNKERLENIDQRKLYSKLTFGYICIWTVGIFIICFFQGFSFCEFQLSDTVMGFLVGTTMFKVIGAFHIILRYLFPQKK